MRGARFLVVMIICGMLWGCGGEMQPDVVSPEVLGKVGLGFYWEVPVRLEEKETLVQLHLLGRNLYLLTNHNRMIVLNAETGIPKWSRELGDKGQGVFRPVHVDNVVLSGKVVGISGITSRGTPDLSEPFDAVVVNTLSNALILDRSDGRQVRKLSLVPPAGAGVTSDGRYLWVGTLKGRYHPIRLRESVQLLGLSTDGPITAPLEYYREQLYVASEDGSFYATRIGDTMKHKWVQQTKGAIIAPFHVDQRGCFVGSQDGCIYAYNPLTGRKLWEPVVCKAPIRDPIQVGENTIFQLACGDAFYAIDVGTGRVRWELPDPRMVLGTIGTDVYLLGRGNNLLIVDEMLGKTRATLPLTGLDLFTANVTTPSVYAAARNGEVYCIRQLEGGHITAEMLKPPAK